jgi:hypothetical protein
MSDGSTVAALTESEQLYDLLDPDVMWYSVGVDSNYTCNGSDDAIACIQRGLEAGLTGRFEVLGERDGFVVVRAVTDPPRPDPQLCQLMRFRDGLIVEMRDFADAQAALSYAGIGT